jgi:DNA-binding SARP family transcriptional activator/tetratricopeptide (TPR) repeat protein
MSLVFRLLGEVAAYRDGQPVDLGHARQRSVLAVLLVEANTWVSVGQLLERIWGECAPPKARDALYSYLSRLRNALTSAAGDEVCITARRGGYVLTVDTAAVDLHQFDRLVALARAADDERAAALFEQALGLWRGDAFADLDTAWFSIVRDQLAGRRISALLDRNDVELRRGRHTVLVTELTASARSHPLDERLAAQLMLALYRCGRSADALEQYQRIRRMLGEELGIDPGSALRQLHHMILTDDPALAQPVTQRVKTPPERPVVPRQLPPPPRSFSGRSRELAELDKFHETGSAGPLISTISGAGGIGKTWLALRWACENSERFPDGQLYANLRGFDPADPPVPSEVVLRGFLDALGVPPDAIPADAAAQAGLYRTLVAGRRLLIVLDNARDSAQVSPLMPGGRACAVLITSRHDLAGLIITHGAVPLELDVLNQAEARQLLADQLGHDRIAAEPAAVNKLLEHCAGLPLALSIVAGRAATHPHLPLTKMAAEMRQSETRLDSLDGGEPSVSLRTIISSSQHALDTGTAEMFALLGIAPGPDISIPAAASLAALSAAAALRFLGNLDRAHLLREHTPGRYRLHDLTRLVAAELAERDCPVGIRTNALRRLTDFYLHTAYHGERLLDTRREVIALEPPEAGCVPVPLNDPAEALAWFDAEHPCLLAAQQLASMNGWHARVWQLSWALTTFHYRRGHRHEHLSAGRAGLAAARHLGDPVICATAHQFVGHALTRVGRHAAAVDHFQQALILAEQTGDRACQALAHHALGWAWDQQGELRRALTHATQAVDLYQALGDPIRLSRALNATGWLYARSGRLEDARAFCDRALTLNRQNQDRQGEASTLDSLGYVAHHTGQPAHALTCYHDALSIYREIGDTHSQASTLDRLAMALTALGHLARAEHMWQQALDLYRSQHRSEDIDRVEHQLAVLRQTPQP